MAKKRKLKRGAKYAQGIAKNQILLLFSNTNSRIEEPELRDIIVKKLNINDPKGIKKHLADLVKDGLLLKEPQRGKENIWSLQKSGFLKLIEKFKNSSDFTEFHGSTYCQNMITPALLREIEKSWNIPPFSSKPVIDKPEVFTEEDCLEILRLSPTALNKSLENQTKNKSSERFEEMLLASLIVDVNTLNCPDFKLKFKFKIGVEFHRPGKEPFFKQCKTDVFFIMPNEY